MTKGRLLPAGVYNCAGVEKYTPEVEPSAEVHVGADFLAAAQTLHLTVASVATVAVAAPCRWACLAEVHALLNAGKRHLVGVYCVGMMVGRHFVETDSC